MSMVSDFMPLSRSAIPHPQRGPRREDQCGEADTRPQDTAHRPRAAMGRPARHEPPLIGQRRHGQRGKQRLGALQPEHTARAQDRECSKSCQDLREHSSTGHQQRRQNRNHSSRLRLGQHVVPQHRDGPDSNPFLPPPAHIRHCEFLPAACLAGFVVDSRKAPLYLAAQRPRPI
jgi:hypothetical protein